MDATKQMNVTIRKALPDDANYLLEFTKADNWKYSWHDYQTALTIDPEFLLVAVDDSHTPIGFGGIIRYLPDTMYIDAFIVREDLRGKGIGRKIWKSLLDKAGESNICLDGRPAVVDWYKKQGFIYESYTVYCYSSLVTKELQRLLTSPYEVTCFSDKLWPALLNYDKQVYLDFNREKMLNAMFKGATVIVAFDGRNVVGYGTIHKQWENNYSIRNVFADDACVAETLIRHLCAPLSEGDVVHFAVIKENPLPIFSTNLKYQGKNMRMYTKAEMKINTDKIWIHCNTKV